MAKACDMLSVGTKAVGIRISFTIGRGDKKENIQLVILLHVLFSPIGGSVAVLLTLGWSLSSSSKNSVVPPVSLATPCRSLLQARGPIPRPKHLQENTTLYLTTFFEKMCFMNYHLHFVFLQSGIWFTAWTIRWMFSLTMFSHLNTFTSSLLQSSVSICESLMAHRGFHVSKKREDVPSNGQNCYLCAQSDHKPFG